MRAAELARRAPALWPTRTARRRDASPRRIRARLGRAARSPRPPPGPTWPPTSWRGARTLSRLREQEVRVSPRTPAASRGPRDRAPPFDRAPRSGPPDEEAGDGSRDAGRFCSTRVNREASSASSSKERSCRGSTPSRAATRGSLRGTLVNERLRLERVDSKLGFSAVFYGRGPGRAVDRRHVGSARPSARTSPARDLEGGPGRGGED